MKTLIRQRHGFTLLEVLIALSIFSLIGLAAYRMLDTVILSQNNVESHQHNIRTLERAIHIIGNDFEQLIERPIRDNYGDPLKAFETNQENYLIEFTRQGWRNPLQLPRSQLQRVAYELGNIGNNADSGVHLLRHYWPVLDRPQDSKPQTQILLHNINDIGLQFMDQEGQWQSQWPQEPLFDAPHGELPKALLIRLDTQAWGNIERVYQLTEFSVVQSRVDNNQPNANQPISQSNRQQTTRPQG